MRQLTLASVSFDKHSKQTRRAKFLAEMDQVVPWRQLCALIEPFYPRSGDGRHQRGPRSAIRSHFGVYRCGLVTGANISVISSDRIPYL